LPQESERFFLTFPQILLKFAWIITASSPKAWTQLHDNRPMVQLRGALVSRVLHGPMTEDSRQCLIDSGF
jgi:hypothetical protein